MRKKIVNMKKIAGAFAENKEIAKEIRINMILPELLKGNDVIFNFKYVDGVTQSFIHAMISEPIREFRDDAFEKLYYKNANDNVKKIISIVYRYMQESLDTGK